MKTFLQRRLFACVLAAGLVATGCTFTTDAPDRDAAKAPSTGGSLRVAITEPATIDPSNASNSVSPGDRSALLVLNQICEPLVSADVATGELKPGAAESWSISSDAKKVTFKLRKGLKFHSGRAVTAADYVFSISRFVHKTTGSPQRFWLDRVVGYNDVAAGRKTTLAGVKAPDAETLVVETSQPFAELPSVLAMVTAGAAAPKQAADKPEFAARPDCTGPYKMSAPWRKGTDKTIRLERVEGYAGSS